MLVDRVLLVQVQFEKAVVIGASEVLVRIDLDEIGCDEVFLRELDVTFAFRPGGIGGCCRGEELLGFYRSVVDLLDELDDVRILLW